MADVDGVSSTADSIILSPLLFGVNNRPQAALPDDGEPLLVISIYTKSPADTLIESDVSLAVLFVPDTVAVNAVLLPLTFKVYVNDVPTPGATSREIYNLVKVPAVGMIELKFGADPFKSPGAAPFNATVVGEEPVK